VKTLQFFSGFAFALLGLPAYAGNLETCSFTSESDTQLNVIDLKPRTSKQNFYYRLGHFVAFISAGDLGRQARARAEKTGLQIDISLARDIARDSSLRDEVDLFKYAMSNPRYVERIDFLIAGSLDAGVVAVADLWGRPKIEYIPTLSRISYSGPSLKKRIYCATNEELVLEVTDSVS
jgi:hypothetical protein